jgi:hypothetical protein
MISCLVRGLDASQQTGVARASSSPIEAEHYRARLTEKVSFEPQATSNLGCAGFGDFI